MGICVGREKVSLQLTGVPPEEADVYDSECQLRLNELKYMDFFASVKRFGFACDLTDDHLSQIAPEIHLDFEEMERNEKSRFALFYSNEDMMTASRRYSVKQLLRIGWLCCKHDSEQQQLADLWHLLNPKLSDVVSRAEVLEFMRALVKFATNTNKCKFVVLNTAAMLVVGQGEIDPIQPSI